MGLQRQELESTSGAVCKCQHSLLRVGAPLSDSIATSLFLKSPNLETSGLHYLREREGETEGNGVCVCGGGV